MTSYLGGISIEPAAYLERWERLGRELGIRLMIQRDDLLPFPLAGNKWIKFLGEYPDEPRCKSVFITNGGISSNHCRTIALWGAQKGIQTEFVLHGDRTDSDNAVSERFLTKLGCSYQVVHPDDISATIAKLVSRHEDSGLKAVVVPGGGHSSEGILSYADYAQPVIEATTPKYILHASGTGGTQAGILLAACRLSIDVHVIGVSIARTAWRGKSVVAESLKSTLASAAEIDFRDDFVDGGYGLHGPLTDAAVALAWKFGLPLDTTYTGKAFAALVSLVQSGEIEEGASVLFWHTGGTFKGLYEYVGS